jgi:hypothetical protein
MSRISKAKERRFKMTNFYEEIDDKNLVKFPYPNENIIQLKVPFRALVIGPTNSGKSIVTMNLIPGIAIWDKIIICAKDAEETLYIHIIEKIRNIETKEKRDILLVVNKLEEIPPLNTFKKEELTMLVIDDFITADPKQLKILNDFYTMGRKFGVCPIFISQSYFMIPLLIRQNANLLFVKKVGSPKDLTRIAAEFATSKTKEEIKEMYKVATEGSACTDFFLIDRENRDENLVYRDGFEPFQYK